MSSRISRVLAVIPAFNAAPTVGAVVRDVKRHLPDVLVVDDGSSDETGAVAREAGAEVIRQEPNRGKGVALAQGFEYARQNGYAAVVTLDADGQHDPADLPRFLSAFREQGARVVVGNRMEQPGGMPLVRRLTNRFMSWLLSRRAGQSIPDSQNGYRLYAREVLATVHTRSEGFAAESEILLRLAAQGERVLSVPTRTVYGNETSAIRPIADTVRFFRMLRSVR